MVELAQLIDPQGRPRKAGQGRLSVRCPAHEDNTPSLTIWVDDKGKAAFNCHAGCSHQKIVDALEPSIRQSVESTWTTPETNIIILRPSHTPAPPVTPSYSMVEGEYPYYGPDGSLHYLVRRFDGKKYRQFHKIGDQLVTGRGPAALVPYRLPDVQAAIRAGDPIYIVEGEKDADTLAVLGLTATCNVGGAGKWGSDETSHLEQASRIIILPDNDPPGQEHARKVKQHLPHAQIVNLPNLPDKGDVTDWLETHTVEELHQATAHPAVEGEEFRFSPGDHIFTIPLEVESIWGKGQECLWAVGEPLMVYGPTGIGKTTLANKLLLSLIGVDSSELLGYPIEPIATGATVLYVAADRPRQAMRSLRRMVPKEAASILAERLRIEHHRQIWASVDDPTMIYRAAVQANASIVFLDSGKDLAGGPLKDEGPAKALMDAIQVCIAYDVDVAILHHPRKATQEAGGKREIDLDDVYGSAWLTAGSGSVILVSGKPGAGIFRLEQLKAPATFVEAMEVTVNYETGELTRRTIRDLDVWLKDSAMPTTIRQATAYKLNVPEEDVDTDSAEYKKVRRHIEDLERDELVVQVDPKGNAKRYQWYENAHL